MRRYLDGVADTFKLPGDFSAAWKTYVEVVHGGVPSVAEHETMAARYRGIILDGLQTYDDNSLSKEEYQALAWKGLAGTKYYKDGVSDADKRAYSENYMKALRSTTDTCN